MKRLWIHVAFAVAVLCAGAPAPAQSLPERIAPDPPFPRIESQAPFTEAIAPGISYARYHLVTASGPLEISVVAVAPQRQDVHVETVLAGDAVTSRGEPVSTMAHRTGAVAGINADYYDIGATNRPTNIVIARGRLLRTPRRRYQLIVTRDGMPHIVESSFTGEVEGPSASVALDAVNEMSPPNGGVSLLTPQFGPVAAEENLTLVPLEPATGTPPFATYRVGSPADNLTRQPPGYYLAVGINAYGHFAIPDAGATIAVSGDLSPISLDSVATAVGGGPLILHGGRWFDDPDGPNGGEYAQRIPSSGAAITPDGTLLLVEIDGRQPEYSVGLNRHEFSALMRALGAIEGMAFDGGGSSELVVRRLGDSEAALTTSPSDGRERDVADGVFVYSTAPVGEAVRLISLPRTIRALPGAPVRVRVGAIDEAGHLVSGGTNVGATVEPERAGTFADGTFVAKQPGAATIHLRDGRLRGDVHVEVAAAPSRVTITPPEINLDEHERVQLTLHAYDRFGYPLALPPEIAWHAAGGTIDARGSYVAGTNNATIDANIGGKTASARVTVGNHSEPLAFAAHARFSTVAPGGEGELTRDPQCERCVVLSFVLNDATRAAYANAPLELPKDSVGLEFDLHDDGDGAALKVALRNAINEQVLLPLTDLSQPGWRHLVVRFPPGLSQPLRLESIYALHQGRGSAQAGTIVIRNVRALVAGS